MMIQTFFPHTDFLSGRLNNLSTEVFSYWYEVTGFQLRRKNNFKIKADYDETKYN